MLAATANLRGQRADADAAGAGLQPLQRPDQVVRNGASRGGEPPLHRLLQDRQPTRVRLGLLQALDGLPRPGAEEVAGRDEPVADLVGRQAEQAAGAERRQHDLDAFLRAVGLRHRIGATQAGEKAGAGEIGRADFGRVLDP